MLRLMRRRRGFLSSSTAAALLWSCSVALPPPMKQQSTSGSAGSNRSTVLASYLAAGGTGSSNLIFHHLREPVNSTQDEARRFLQQLEPETRALAVVADIQVAGRGTQGRKWENAAVEPSPASDGTAMSDGNLYLTVCLPLDQIPVTLTLLPLQIGALVAERVSKLLAACQTRSQNKQVEPPKVTVKWPNDVLVGGRKISGTLIENESVGHQTWLLVGIGVNVAAAPHNLESSPGKHGRPACSVQDSCDAPLPPNAALVLGRDVATALADWVGDGTDTTKFERDQAVLDRWKSYAAPFGSAYELRGRVVDEERGGYQGEMVVTVNIERDGRLRVRGEDGNERLLSAEYLF